MFKRVLISILFSVAALWAAVYFWQRVARSKVVEVKDAGAPSKIEASVDPQPVSATGAPNLSGSISATGVSSTVAMNDNETDNLPEDPNFPKDRYIYKPIVDKNGKKHVLYLYRDKSDYFEPNTSDKSRKDAIDLLDRKRSEDFVEEFESLKPISGKSTGNDQMVSGHFSDAGNQVEFALGFDEENDKQAICFYSKETGLVNGQPGMAIRADSEGYSIFKISDNAYVRFMWSFDKERILYGDLFQKQQNSWVLVKRFGAVEAHMTKGEFLNKCTSMKYSN